MNNQDICFWPDGSWCFREELEEMLTFQSDDFEIIKEDTQRWRELAKDQ